MIPESTPESNPLDLHLTPIEDTAEALAEHCYYNGLLGTQALAMLPVTKTQPDAAVLEAQTRMEMSRMLPETPCSVNVRFSLKGYCDSAQATGRGWTPAEAASNLKATIDATRAALEAPTLPTLGSLLEKGLACAVTRNDPKLAQRLMKAAWYVQQGAVTCDPDGPQWHVQGSQETPYIVYTTPSLRSCSCPDWEKRGRETGTLCCHLLSTVMFQKIHGGE